MGNQIKGYIAIMMLIVITLMIMSIGSYNKGDYTLDTYKLKNDIVETLKGDN